MSMNTLSIPEKILLLYVQSIDWKTIERLPIPHQNLSEIQKKMQNNPFFAVWNRLIARRRIVEISEMSTPDNVEWWLLMIPDRDLRSKVSERLQQMKDRTGRIVKWSEEFWSIVKFIEWKDK